MKHSEVGNDDGGGLPRNNVSQLEWGGKLVFRILKDFKQGVTAFCASFHPCQKKSLATTRSGAGFRSHSIWENLRRGHRLAVYGVWVSTTFVPLAYTLNGQQNARDARVGIRKAPKQ